MNLEPFDADPHHLEEDFLDDLYTYYREADAYATLQQIEYDQHRTEADCRQYTGTGLGCTDRSCRPLDHPLTVSGSDEPKLPQGNEPTLYERT